MAQFQPSIDYLVKDYESFRQLMLDRLSATLPAWQERHAPDLGIAIVEALAYVADYLSYYQDAAATESYLGTARQRISVRRHARLLDYFLHEGCNARALVQCRVAPLPDGRSTRDREIRLHLGDLHFIASNDRTVRQGIPGYSQNLIEMHQEIFEPVETGSITLHSDLNELAIVRPLKDGALAAEIRLPSDVQPRKGAILILRRRGTFEDKQDDARGAGPPVDRFHPVLLTDCTMSDGACTITWHAEDALPRDMADCPLVALGNVVLADHGMRVEDADLVTRSGRAGPLSRLDLTHRMPRPLPSLSAAARIAQDPREALPDVKKLTIHANTAKGEVGEAWQLRRDLLDTLPEERHFCVEIDDRGRGWVRFGDGAGTGARPEEGALVTACFRVGNGPAGNVAAGSIRAIRSTDGNDELDKITVWNPMPAVGGAEPESMASARLLAPGNMRVLQHRAISAGDYADAARDVDGVANAVATIRREGTRRVIGVAVDPKGQRISGVDPALATMPIGRTLRQRVMARLESVRRINHEVIVHAPRYVELEVELLVTILPSHVPELVRAEIVSRLCGKAASSFFNPDNLTFGQSIHWSQLAATVHAVPGVVGVTPVKFRRRNPPIREAATPGGRIEIGVMEIAYLLASDRTVTVVTEPSQAETERAGQNPFSRGRPEGGEV